MLAVIQEEASLVVADGTRLDADIYRPDCTGAYPVLLMRQPYGRRIASTVVYAHPRWYAAHGYIVVIQDVRGRGTSEGDFRLFANDRDDGLATVNWAAQLPGSTGAVGMYGFSYQGMTQLYAAEQQPSALKTICPAMVGYDVYHDWAYEGGAFCLQASLGWALQMAAETARLRGDAQAFSELRQAAQSLPLNGAIASQPECLRRLAPDSFYWDWLQYPDPAAAYWQHLQPDLTQVDLPMLHIGGWFDTYLRGTVRLYRELAAQAQTPQHLWIGPWAHIPWGRTVGMVDFGPAANSPIDQLQVRWFDHWLKGIDTGLLEQPPVQLFEMGPNRWRSLSHWPTDQPQSELQYFQLSSNGLASIRQDAGSLKPLDPAVEQKLKENTGQTEQAVDVLVHDPWRPVPALGGHASFPGGVFDRRNLDCRSDVLSYTTSPLEHDLSIQGDIWLELMCSTDAPSFDLCAVLSRVTDQGVFNISQGCLRVANQTTQKPPYRVTLQPTCVVIPKGQALRLSLSAACYPAYAVNPGTGHNPDQSNRLSAQIITLQVVSGGQTPATLAFASVARSAVL